MLSPSAPPLRLAWFVWGLGALLYLLGFYQRVAPAAIADQLMAEFAINGAALGNLSAFYFYAYVAMQIPTGILADRWGPRRVLTAGAGAAAIGMALFAFAPNLAWAAAGRFIVGMAVAVAFVSTLKLSSHWFEPRRYALASGVALATGVVGGVFAGMPLRALVETFGWRTVMGASAIFSALLCVAIWRWVRDDPSERGYAGHFRDAHTAHASASIWHGITQALSYRNVWLLTLVPIGFSGPVLTFAGLWGVPWLSQVHGLDAKTAAAMTSTLLVAWALGGPALGAWSERSGKRKPLYVASSAVTLAGWALIVYAPLPLFALAAVLALTGAASGGLIIGFAWVKESVPPRLAGTATGICNMGPLMGGMLLQPGVGWILDRYWQGALANGVRIYDAAAYQAGFGLMFATACVAMGLILLTRESHCRPLAG